MAITFTEDDFTESETPASPLKFSEADFAPKQNTDSLRATPVLTRARQFVEDLAPSLLSTQGTALEPDRPQGFIPKLIQGLSTSPLQEIPRIPHKEGASIPAQVGAGAVDVLQGTAEFLTSPVGVATLATAGAGPAASRLVAGGFAPIMAKQSYDKLSEAVREGDWRAGTEGVLIGAMGGLGAKHALTTPKVKIKPSDVRALDESVAREKGAREKFYPEDFEAPKAEPLKPKEAVAEIPTEVVSEPVVVEPKVATDIISEVKADISPRGDTNMAGDFWKKRFKDAPDDQLVEFLKWTRTKESPPWVSRFVGDHAADALRARGVPVDSTAWQAEIFQGIKPPKVEPVAEVPKEASDAALNLRGAEKRLRRALRQEPTDVEAAQKARDDAQVDFEAIAQKTGLTEEVYRSLKEITEKTDTSQMPEVLAAEAPKVEEPQITAPVAELEGVGSVYESTHKGNPVWMVQESPKRGFGDSIWETRDAADASARITKMNAASRAETMARLEKEKAAVEKSKVEMSDFDGFEKGMTPLQRGKLVSTLSESKFNYKGTAISRRDLIRKLVEEGRTVKVIDGERVLSTPDGENFMGAKTLTKAGLDYADHLVSLKSEIQNIALETPKTPIETINTAPKVKVSAPEGSTTIRATDSKGRVATQSMDAFKGTNPLQGADIVKIEAGTMDKGGKFKPIKGEVGISHVEKPAPKMAEGLESWADDVIKKARGRVSSGLDPELITAYAVKGAAVIVRGVYEAGAWAAEMVREYGDEIREHLPEIRRRANELIDNNFQGVDMPARLDPKMGERAHPKMVDASSKISNDVRLRQGPRLYERRSNEGDAAAARKILEESGIESAERMYRDPNSEMPGSVRTMLGDEIVDFYGRQEQLAAMTGDKVAERKAFEAQSEFLEDVTTRSTDVAQSLQAYKRWGKASISVVMAKAKQVIEKADGEFKPEVADSIKKQHQKIKDAPEGFQKTREEIELANIIAKAAGVKWWDLPLAMWYANILTGVTTHAVNVVSAASNFGMNIAIEAMKNPSDAPGLAQAAVRGGRKGLTEAREVWETGKVTGSRLQKAEALRTLELHTFKGLMKPFNLLKYNGRLMSAEDLILFKGAEEARAFSAARKIGRKEGLSGVELERRVVEVMGHTKERLAEAREQAKSEDLTGRDFKRRVDELVEMSRPDSLKVDARDWALKTTFNQKPAGFLGAVADGINQVATKYPATRLVVPFTNIVANVMNSGLDYFPPTSAWRAIRASGKNGKLDGKPVTDKSLIVDQWIKAGAGTAAISVLGLLAAKFSNDPDPTFAITGNGPDSVGHKRQLAERGWIPNSIKVGNKYYSYAWSPMAYPMAVLGNYMDAVKYKQIDKTDLDNRLAYAMGASARVVLEQGFLSGISDLIEFLQRDSPKKSSEKMARWMTKTASSVVVPNLVRQIDRIFDPTVYDAKTVKANLYASVPFVRRLNKPALNVLGQPVQRFVSERFLSEGRADPVWKLLADKNVWVSTPDRDTLVNEVPLSDDEYYRYVELSGKDIHQWIGEYTEAIKEADDKEASRILRKLTDVARDRAKAVIQSERK